MWAARATARRVRLGWAGRSRTRLRIRGIVGAVPTINTTFGACEGLDVVWPWSSRRGRSVQEADQDGRPSGAARAAINLSVVRGVGSSMVVPGSVGSYRPVIAGAKLREGTTTILPRGRALQRVGLSSMRFHPIGGARRRQRRTSSMVHGKNRIPYWIDRRLPGLAGPVWYATTKRRRTTSDCCSLRVHSCSSVANGDLPF